jgi:hypothetical protein
MFYVILLIVYISETYLQICKYDEDGNRISPPVKIWYLYMISGCLVYPLIYDGNQFIKQGPMEYFEDPWNFLDIGHITLGYFNIYSQIYLGSWEFIPKCIMITVILLCLVKMFFFMRIFKKLSYIVTMIMQVMKDLRVFFLFFTLLISMFSLVFDVITINSSPDYVKVGTFVGSLIGTLRLSLGDTDFNFLEDDHMDTDQHYLFWICWVVVVIFSALIFLNFIIAEVSNSYQIVRESIDALIYKERAGLINEAEDILTLKYKNNKDKFPRFIVAREIDS